MKRKKMFILLAAVISVLFAAALAFGCSSNEESNNKNGGGGSTGHKHSYGEWYPFDEGQHERVCSECLEKEKKAHSFSDGVCTICNYLMGMNINGTPGLDYAISEDGTYYICTGKGEATETDITIAMIYEGLPVKEIYPGAFECWRDVGKIIVITSVKIPNSITSIGARAFYDCHELTSINIPDSVTSFWGTR